MTADNKGLPPNQDTDGFDADAAGEQVVDMWPFNGEMPDIAQKNGDADYLARLYTSVDTETLQYALSRSKLIRQMTSFAAANESIGPFNARASLKAVTQQEHVVSLIGQLHAYGGHYLREHGDTPAMRGLVADIRARLAVGSFDADAAQEIAAHIRAREDARFVTLRRALYGLFAPDIFAALGAQRSDPRFIGTAYIREQARLYESAFCLPPVDGVKMATLMDTGLDATRAWTVLHGSEPSEQS